MGQELHLVIPESTMTKNILPDSQDNPISPLFLTHRKRLKQVCQEHKEPHNLCYAETQIFPQKALTVYRENEKQLDNHVITLRYLKAGQERKKQILVCSLMNRNSWLTTE